MARRRAIFAAREPETPVRRSDFRATEPQIQRATLDHWKQFGLPDTLVAAVPNANAHGQAGLTPGLPDLLVMGPSVPCTVAFIELKRDMRSHVSPAQIEFQALCKRLDIQCWIVAGYDAAIGLLENWGIVKPRARAA
jgi:hypothetical protein